MILFKTFMDVAQFSLETEKIEILSKVGVINRRKSLIAFNFVISTSDLIHRRLCSPAFVKYTISKYYTIFY